MAKGAAEQLRRMREAKYKDIARVTDMVTTPAASVTGLVTRAPSVTRPVTDEHACPLCGEVHGGRAMTPAEKQRAYRARQRSTAECSDALIGEVTSGRPADGGGWFWKHPERGNGVHIDQVPVDPNHLYQEIAQEDVEEDTLWA